MCVFLLCLGGFPGILRGPGGGLQAVPLTLASLLPQVSSSPAPLFQDVGLGVERQGPDSASPLQYFSQTVPAWVERSLYTRGFGKPEQLCCVLPCPSPLEEKNRKRRKGKK